MAPDLHLRPRPEQAEVLWVVLGKPGDLGVPLRVRPQLFFPAGGLLLRHDAAYDHAPGLPYRLSQAVRQVPIAGFDGGEVDLRDGLGPCLGDAIGFGFEDLGQAVVRLDQASLVLRFDDGLLEPRVLLVQERAAMAMIRVRSCLASDEPWRWTYG